MAIPFFENLKQVIRFLFFNYCNLFMWEKHRHRWHSIPACISKMVKVAKTYGKRCIISFSHEIHTKFVASNRTRAACQLP